MELSTTVNRCTHGQKFQQSLSDPMIAKHNLFHFRGHILRQSRRRNHFEAFIVRIYPYIGHEVEHEMFISNISREENLWSRYGSCAKCSPETSLFQMGKG